MDEPLHVGRSNCTVRRVIGRAVCTLQEAEYVEWMAGLKLACRGRTMADRSGYQAELHALRSLLRLHHNCPSSPPAAASASVTSSAAETAGDAGEGGDKTFGVRVQDLIAARHCNRLRHKQVPLTASSHADWRGSTRRPSRRASCVASGGVNWLLSVQLFDTLLNTTFSEFVGLLWKRWAFKAHRNCPLENGGRTRMIRKSYSVASAVVQFTTHTPSILRWRHFIQASGRFYMCAAFR